MKYKLFLSSLFCFLIFAQCQDSKPTCKYKSPTAIFSKNLEPVLNHNFEVKEQESREGVIFKNGIKMEILQSGCNEISQVFRFYIPGDLKDKDKDYWIEMAIQHFAYLSTVSNEHFTLHHWSDAIKEIFHEIKLGQEMELQPGYNIKIDKVISSDHAQLIVELNGNL